MKAIIVNEFGAPEVLKLEDIPDPKPGPGEVVVRVRAVGVNPLDTYMRAGTYGVRNPALPYTPGTDAAGTVESLGPSVDESRDRRPRLHRAIRKRDVCRADPLQARAGASTTPQCRLFAGCSGVHPIRDRIPRALSTRSR
jgi:hypothetical protein